MGTLIRLVPPAPALARALAVDERTAARAFAAEARYYIAHHLEGSDPQRLEALRDRCAGVLAAEAGVPVEGARDILLASLRFEAFPDVAPALAAMRERGLSLVVCSNWDCLLPDVLERIGVLELVDAVVASAVVGAAKPDPPIFKAALEAAGCAPGEALHVGDSPDNDVEGARAAGIRALLLDRSGGTGDIASLAELPSLLS